jgi:hypothetical protein
VYVWRIVESNSALTGSVPSAAGGLVCHADITIWKHRGVAWRVIDIAADN